MRKNKSAKQSLIKLYGKGCMFKRAKIAQKIEAIGGIKTYKKFIEEKRYTLKEVKALENKITFHHLKHKEESGEATPENGANINELAHRYLHSLPREQEEVINDMLREYKKAKVVFVDGIDLPFEVNAIIIEPNELCKRPYNRAKKKKEIKCIIEEEMEI